MKFGQYKRIKTNYQCSKCGVTVGYHPTKLNEMCYSPKNIYKQEKSYCLCKKCYGQFEQWITK